MKLFGLEIKKSPKTKPNRLIGSLTYGQKFDGAIFPDIDFYSLLKANRGWVYTCSSKNAVSIASTPIRLYVGKRNNIDIKSFKTVKVSKAKDVYLREKPSLSSLTRVKQAVGIEEVLEHPLLDMFNSVNNFMNKFYLFELTSLYQELCGNAYWYILENRLGVPVEIWPVPPQHLMILPDKVKFIKGYELRKGMDKIPFDEKEIIHFKFPSVTSVYYGRAPLSAVTDAYNIHQSMNQYELAIFKNMGKLEGAFETEQELSQYEFDRLKEELSQSFGGVKNVGKSPLLEKGVSFKSYTSTPRDLSYLSGRTKIKEEICFVPDTNIITSEGIKKIKDICIGDSVLTHKGRFKRVKRTFARHYNGDIVTIKAKGFDEVSSTPNHPFIISESIGYANRISGSEKIKKSIDIKAREKHPTRAGKYNVQNFDYGMLPRFRINNDECIIDISESIHDSENLSIENDYIIMDNFNANPINRYIKLDNRFGRLIGLFLAEGCVGDGRQVLFYFNVKEDALCNEVMLSLKKIFGIKSKRTKAGENLSAARICATSKPLARFFMQFGHLAPNKHIPEWVFKTNKDFIDGIINGLVDGDGIKYKDAWGFVSSSISLIWQCRMIILSKGIYASFYKKEKNTGFVEPEKAKPLYHCAWKLNGKGNHFVINDDFVKGFIKKKETTEYSGLVYNVEVEDDNTYTTTGGVVHNCNAYGQSIALWDKDATRANATVANENFMRDAIRPRLIRMEEKLNEKLTPRYDGKLFLAFDDPVPEDREYKLKERESNLKTGYSSINIERDRDNADKVEWGDWPVINTNMVKLDLERNLDQQPQGNIPPKVLETMADDLTKIFINKLKQ